MKLKKVSLRLRIFIGMISLVLLASILIAVVTIYQYNEEAQDYHRERLERKEIAITEHIDFVLRDRQTTYEITTQNIPRIFKEKIFEIAEIHGMQINLYDLEGDLLISSRGAFAMDSIVRCLDPEVLNAVSQNFQHRFVNKTISNKVTYQSSYSFITDNKFKPLAILNLPYLENDEFLNKELNEFLLRLGFAYSIMILVAIAFAFILSRFITKSLKTVSDKMAKTRLEYRNEKIDIQDTSQEIETLVTAYNSMIDELEESAVKLATSEREQAWREMAKQVAHEIKNPLTPMRLSIQSFERKFDPQDENIKQKLNEFSKTLIQQIDTMSSIASAFSTFAKMPAQKNETLNVVEITKLALDIFNEDYISFISEQDKIIAKFDRTQLIRVVTNLVKNGIQAIPEDQENKRIVVDITKDEFNVIISVSDNGIGIAEAHKTKVFEPKFTTKSSGMGLGLAMVKNIVETYNGTISFTSNPGRGTIFKVSFLKV
ncbi:sensor histidine kinase [Paucihalobacter sp.]|uniref:sensor histidine kinase n=1 Tax=Paucihalobacter sp. TaxID=2850405 RepID=UPI003D160375